MKFYNILFMLVLMFSMILNIYLIIDNPNNSINLGEKDLNCSNKDIFTTSHCLGDELNEFYNYNISNVGKGLNLSELKEQGGVCEHYADWYKDNFINLGAEQNKQIEWQPIQKTNPKFYISEIVFSIDNETAHVISIVSNKEGYCLLDMLDVNCWRFENE